MKSAFYLLLSFFLVSTYSQANNGGTVHFGGYVYEESCSYKTNDNQLTTICSKDGQDERYSHKLNALNEKTTAVSSVKLSGINLSNIDENNAIITAFYL